MRKSLTAAVVIAALATSMTGTAHAKDTNLDRACRFQLSDGRYGWTTQEVRWTIRCAANRWNVSLDTAMYIAQRESGFRQFAYNPSGCSGIYQWARGTWAVVLPRWTQGYAVLGHNVFNARTNVLMAIYYAHRYGWGPWS